jgi:hypothetical protein
LKHVNEPDHYIDVEELALYGMKPESLPVFRDDFIAQLALVRNAHPKVSSSRTPPTTKPIPGSWSACCPGPCTENYGKLKSGFFVSEGL